MNYNHRWNVYVFYYKKFLHQSILKRSYANGNLKFQSNIIKGGLQKSSCFFTKLGFIGEVERVLVGAIIDRPQKINGKK